MVAERPWKLARHNVPGTAPTMICVLKEGVSKLKMKMLETLGFCVICGFVILQAELHLRREQFVQQWLIAWQGAAGFTTEQAYGIGQQDEDPSQAQAV